MRWLPDHGVGVITMANLTYSVGGRTGDRIFGVLAETGALSARVPAPSPALLAAAADTARMVDAWDDDRMKAIAALNLFLDEPLDKRRAALKALRDPLGACKALPIRPRMHCAARIGWRATRDGSR
jgi:hypothetical protein